jgi:hypothetical protein
MGLMLVMVGSVVVGCWWLRRGWREDMRRRDTAMMMMMVAAQDEARAYGRVEGMMAQAASDVAEDPPRPGLRLVD